MAINPFGTKTMKRLSLEELKAQVGTKVIFNLEAVQAGGPIERPKDGVIKCDRA